LARHIQNHFHNYHHHQTLLKDIETS